MNIKTSRLTIKTFSLDMAQNVYENSQDDDIRRFVPDEVYDSVEEAREAIEFLMQLYKTDDGPSVYPIITKENDWFQIKEDVEINCEICKKTEREFIRITTSKKNKKDTAK